MNHDKSNKRSVFSLLKGQIMKKFKAAIFTVLCLLTATIPVAADSITPGHNTSFRLAYGSGYTSCVDSTGSYLISATANSPQAFVGVEIYTFDSRVAWDSSSSYSQTAVASYHPRQSVPHSFKANSALMAR